MIRFHYISFVLIFFIAYNSVKSQSIIINEIMCYPQNSEPEWIELLNISGDIISNDSLFIADPTRKYSFALNQLKPNQYCVLVKDTILLKNYRAIPDSALLIQTKIPSLNNDGDSLFLFNSQNVIIDSFYYSGKIALKGFSIERKNPSLPAISEQNLGKSLSIDSTTCGRINSYSIEKPKDTTIANEIEITGNPFSPNSPNGKNKCEISINFPYNIKSFNLKIYDMNGNQVKSLAENLSLNSYETYNYIWDGTNEKGYIMQVGIYPLIITYELDGEGSNYQLTFSKLIVLAN